MALFLIFTNGLGTSEVKGLNLCPCPPQRMITVRFFLNSVIFKVINLLLQIIKRDDKYFILAIKKKNDT
jgi:hypothetical protein